MERKEREVGIAHTVGLDKAHARHAERSEHRRVEQIVQAREGDGLAVHVLAVGLARFHAMSNGARVKARRVGSAVEDAGAVMGVTA
jgi:hypothetical protein